MLPLSSMTRHFMACSNMRPISYCWFSQVRMILKNLDLPAHYQIQTLTTQSSCCLHRNLAPNKLNPCMNDRMWVQCKRLKSTDFEERETEWRRKPKLSLFNSGSGAMRQDRAEGLALFRDLMEKNGSEIWTASEWDEAAALISSSMKGPWDAMCMQTLYTEQNVSLARSLMNYLEDKDVNPNRVTVTYFIALLGSTSCDDKMQDEEVKKYYNDFMSVTDLLDAATIEVLIKGLAYSSHYLECLKLLEICKETHSPGPSMMVHVLLAGLRNHNMDLCEHMLSEFEQAIEPTQLHSHIAEIVRTCLSAQNQSGLERVMEFVQKHGLLIHKENLDEVKYIFQRHQPGQWTGTYGYIHHRGGNCVVCKHQMDKISILEEEFSSLRSAFTDQVIIGSNIFYKSTPEELKHFMNFIDTKGPFDVVIDGLNVIHKGPKPPRRERLERTVAYFAESNKKILILGSKALKISASNFRHAKSKPVIYMTSTTKADDVFFLYAAIQSGKDTLIVTFDKLRDHKFRLEPKLRPIFHKWLKSVQIYDWFFSRYGEFGIRRRHLYHIGPAKDNGGWHFPVNDCDRDAPYGKLGVLCLRQGRESSKPRRNPQKYTTGKRSAPRVDVEKEWFQA